MSLHQEILDGIIKLPSKKKIQEQKLLLEDTIEFHLDKIAYHSRQIELMKKR